MKERLIGKMAFLICASIVMLVPGGWSQDQTNTAVTAPAETSVPAQAKAQTTVKTKPSPAEQEAGTAEAAEALQKATQNPVASLISVPVQDNTNFGVEPGYRNQNVLNIQPVIPIGVSKDWNLIVRWITPIIYQPVPNAPGTPETGEYGLGDIVADLLSFATKARKNHLGRRTNFSVANRNGYISRAG